MKQLELNPEPFQLAPKFGGIETPRNADQRRTQQLT
jgi:hypothetical protein